MFSSYGTSTASGSLLRFVAAIRRDLYGPRNRWATQRRTQTQYAFGQKLYKQGDAELGIRPTQC